MLDTGSLGWSDAAGHDRSRSITIGGSVSLPVGGGNNDSGPGSNLPLPSMPFETASLDYSKTDREQVTRATIGAPNGSTAITVRETPAQNLSELNSDLAKAQEITKDTKASVRVYIDMNAINEIANGLPTIGAGLEQLGEGYR